MKKIIYYVLSIMLLCVFLSSFKKPKNKTKDYLPLQVNNFWQFEHMEKRMIVGTKMIDNKEFFIIVRGLDTSYYRNENNKIIVKEYGSKPAVKFDLNADVNDTWEYNKYKVRLISKTDSIVIDSIPLTNCYHFFLDVPLMVDDEHSIWLAPGIGFVQETCGECVYPIKKLKYALINSLEIKK